MSNQGENSDSLTQVPTVGGLRVRPSMAVLLYVFLFASGFVWFWQQRQPSQFPEWTGRIAPLLFLVFAVGFAAYRGALVMAGRYSPFKAFFQIGVAFTVFLLLQNPDRSPKPTITKDFNALLSHPSPTVRALSVELLRFRPEGPQYARAAIALLDDENVEVRNIAHRTLVELNGGNDLGLKPEPWYERFP